MGNTGIVPKIGTFAEIAIAGVHFAFYLCIISSAFRMHEVLFNERR